MVKNLKAIFLFLFMINISLFFFACANNGGNYNISEPEEIRLSKTSLNLLVGQSETLTVNTYKNVVWESENEYIASVSGGTVVGITEGTANVYAKIGSTVLTCQVTVTETPAGVPSLVLDNPTDIVYEGYTLEIYPVIKNGLEFLDAENITFNWSSSNTQIAAMESGTTTGGAPGIVRGISEGNATITAECTYGGKSLKKTCTITVSSLYVYFLDKEQINLFGASEDLGITGSESSEALKLYSLDLSNQDIVEVTDAINWSSKNPDIAAVSGDGVVTGVTSGVTEIVAEYNGFEVSAFVSVYVPVSQKSHLDQIALATYNYRNDAQKLDKILSDRYMLTNDIDYNNELILPIASTKPSEWHSQWESRISYESQNWKRILNLNDFTGFEGINPTGAAFKGIINGNGYSIKNARLLYDNYLYYYPTNQNFTPLGACFIGYNEGTLENIAFENLTFYHNYSKNEFQMLYGYENGIPDTGSAPGPVNPITIRTINGANSGNIMVGRVSSATGVNNYASAIYLVSINKGTIRNIFVETTNKMVDRELNVFSSATITFKNQAGSVIDGVVIDVDIDTAQSTYPNYGLIFRTRSVNTVDGIQVADNEIKNCIVICSANGIGSLISGNHAYSKMLYGTQINGSFINGGGGELPLPNCGKYENLSGFLSEAASNPSITAPFDKNVWNFADDARPALKKGNVIN